MSEPLGTRVVLRSITTPLPLDFPALAVSTVLSDVLRRGWLAALTAPAATVPLQLLASVMGFLTRDPVGRPKAAAGVRPTVTATREGWAGC